MLQLNDGDVANFRRSLEMTEDVLQKSFEYFTKQSESMAAMHVSSKVMYSPICTMLDEALRKVRSMRSVLGT